MLIRQSIWELFQKEVETMADELYRDYKEGGIRMRITNDRIVTAEDDDSVEDEHARTTIFAR